MSDVILNFHAVVHRVFYSDSLGFSLILLHRYRYSGIACHQDIRSYEVIQSSKDFHEPLLVRCMIWIGNPFY